MAAILRARVRRAISGPDSLGHQCIIKLPKRARLGSGNGRGTLVEVLEIVIVIAVQSTNRDRFLGTL